MRIVNASLIFPGLPDELMAIQLWKSEFRDPCIRLIAVGDIGFSGGVRKTCEASGNYEEIFSDLKPLINSGDLLFGNLETPLINNATPQQLFAGDPTAISALKSIGFKLLHLANNHVLDYGLSGFMSTIECLKLNKIIPLGVGETKNDAKNLIITDVNGIRIGWLGCGRTHIDQKDGSPVFWEFDEKELIYEVKISKSQVDILILSIHTGLMYLDYPKPEMKTFTEQLFNSGVNLILMHHAHVLQSVQVQQNGNTCCYNLGNFVFDWQEGNVVIPIMQKEQNESAVFVFDIGKKGVLQAVAIPTYIDEHFAIRWAINSRGQDILNRLLKISNDILVNYSELYEHQRVQRNSGPIIKVIVFHLKNRNWGYIREQLTHIRFEHIKMFWDYLIQHITGNN